MALDQDDMTAGHPQGALITVALSLERWGRCPALWRVAEFALFGARERRGPGGETG